MVVSIFIASSVISFCPLATVSPDCTATTTTMPGMLAPTCFGFLGSAFTALTESLFTAIDR